MDVQTLRDKLAPDPEKVLRTRKLFRIAGIGYGLIFSLAFAGFTWGYDGFQLAINGSELGWVKFAIGLPIVLLIGTLAGWLGTLSTLAVLPIVVWIVTCIIFGLIGAHMPFEGFTQVVWALEPRLQDVVLSVYGESAEVRTTLLVLIISIIGALVGFVEHLAVQWAWDRGTSEIRMSWGSWAVLLVGVPIAVLPSLTVDGFIQKPLRASQQVLGTLVRQVSAGKTVDSGILGTSYRSVEPFIPMFSDRFTTHFVEFSGSSGLWESSYVDAVFDNGFILRCAASDEVVIYCDDFSDKFTGWIGDLVQAGLTGERPWLESKVRRLSVEDEVVSWLVDHQNQMSNSFEVFRDRQINGWIFVLTHFDNGFEMQCRFRDAGPIVVDQCVEK